MQSLDAPDGSETARQIAAGNSLEPALAAGSGNLIADWRGLFERSTACWGEDHPVSRPQPAGEEVETLLLPDCTRTLERCS